MGRLVSIEEVKDYAGIKREERDTFLGRLIDGAETFVENRTGRRFSPDPVLTGDPPADTEPPVTKTFATRGSHYVAVPDLREITSLTLGGQLLDADFGYSLISQRVGEPAYQIEFASQVLPVNAWWLTNAAEHDLSITGRWGFAETPADVKDAVCQLVARRYKRREANWADVIQAGPDAAAFSYSRNLPAEVREVLESYTVRERVVLI